MPAQQSGGLEWVAHAAAGSLPQHAAPFSGLLAEEDDLMDAELSPEPSGLTSEEPVAPSDGMEFAAMRMPAAVDAEQLEFGELQTGGAAAAAEHEIDTMLEDVLESATDYIEAVAGPLAIELGAAPQELHEGSLQDWGQAVGMQATAQDAGLQQLARQGSTDHAQPNSMTATGGDLRYTVADSGDKPWADMEEASISSTIETLLQDTITDGPLAE
jgi:hypothetical protein